MTASHENARPGRRAPGLWPILMELSPYVWPSQRGDLKFRILLSFVVLILAKLATVAMPYGFKWATDALTEISKGAVLPTSVFAGPIALTLLYGGLRVAMVGLTQARDALFAAVAMNAVRRLALDVFVHLHGLPLRFHLERKTGALTRVLERGRNAIETLTRLIMLTGIPTLFELALVFGVLFFQFDARYVAIVLLTVVAYLSWTMVATNWRIAIRRSMNESDSDANAKAINSLLNYETVKYFGAEQREAERYDRTMAIYEHNSVKSYVSLTVLNFGPGPDLHRRHDRADVVVRHRDQGRAQQCRRFRSAQHHDDPALPAAKTSWGWSTARPSRR